MFTVAIKGDRTVEPDETFLLNLSNPINATITDGQGVATILNDDTRITINDVRITEGNSGARNAVFTVRLAGAGNFPVTVNYVTADGTATAGSDYLARSGTLTFGRRQASKTIAIPILGDRLVEPNETFHVRLSGATYAIITDGEGKGTILNDDRRAAHGAVALSRVPVTPTTVGSLSPLLSVPDSPLLSAITNAESFVDDGKALAAILPQGMTWSRRRHPLWPR